MDWIGHGEQENFSAAGPTTLGHRENRAVGAGRSIDCYDDSRWHACPFDPGTSDPHRSPGISQDSLRDAAEEDPANAEAAVCAEYDQVGQPIVRLVDNLSGRGAESKFVVNIPFLERLL